MAHSKLLLSIHSSHHSVKAIDETKRLSVKKKWRRPGVERRYFFIDYDLVLICPKCCYCHLAR